MNSKPCPRCSIRKQMEEFPLNRRNAKTGRASYCKSCQNEYSRGHYSQNKAKYAKRQRSWRSANRQRLAEYSTRWRQANREQVLAKARSREAKRRAAGLIVVPPTDARRKIWRAYYQRHKEVLAFKRAQHREKVNSRNTAWRRANPEKWAAISAAQRAKRKSTHESFTAGEWKDLKERYGNRCLCCGSTGPLTADHVIPLSKGGRGTIDNIQPLCKSCNSTKHTKCIDYRADAEAA